MVFPACQERARLESERGVADDRKQPERAEPLVYGLARGGRRSRPTDCVGAARADALRAPMRCRAWSRNAPRFCGGGKGRERACMTQ